ncbi:MAG: dihydropteroate synthase, partial [Opitutales bacterium]
WGPARKPFLANLHAAAAPDERLAATRATTALGVAAGVDVFRVHDVRANRRAAMVADAICRVHDRG